MHSMRRNRVAPEGTALRASVSEPDLRFRAKKMLEDNGYSVIRGSGSKGEVFGEKTDLIATKETRGTKKSAHMIIVQ